MGGRVGGGGGGGGEGREGERESGRERERETGAHHDVHVSKRERTRQAKVAALERA